MEENSDKNKLSPEDVHKLKMEPPDDAWDKLAAALDKKQPVAVGNTSGYLRWAAVGIILLLSATLLYFYLTPKEVSSPTAVNDKKEIPVAKNNSAAVVADENKKEVSNQPVEKTSPASSEKKSVSVENSSPKEKNVATTSVDVKESRKKNSVVKKSEGELVMNEVKHSGKHIQKKTSVVKNENVASSKENISSAIDNNNVKETQPVVATTSSSENSSPDVSSATSETKESSSTTSASSPVDTSAKETTAVNEAPKIIQATNDSAATKTQNDSTATAISGSHFSVSAFYSPDYSKEHLTPNTPAAKNYIAEYKNTEQRQYAYSAGIAVAYDLSKHLSIATGGVYSTLAYTINEPVIYAGYGSDNQLHFNYHTSCGTIQVPNPYNTTLQKGDSLVFGSHGTQVLRFISIPLMLKYQIPGNIISLYVFSGVSANLMMQERATLVINNSETTVINNVDGLKKMNYGFLVGAGLQYHVSNRMGIFAEPFYRASISSLTENLPFNCYPYSLGMNLGLSLHF